MCLPEQGHDQPVSGQLRAELEAVADLAALVGQDVEQIPGSEVRAPDGLEVRNERSRPAESQPCGQESRIGLIQHVNTC